MKIEQLTSSDELATLKEEERIESLEIDDGLITAQVNLVDSTIGEKVQGWADSITNPTADYAANKWGKNLEDWDEEPQE